MTLPLAIGVDLDGVCYDFGESVVRYSRQLGLTGHTLPQPVSWAFYEAWGMTYAEFEEHCANGVDDGVIFAGPPYPGAAEALRTLNDVGHRLHIKTARSYGAPGRAAAVTRSWLRQYRIPYSTLTFTADKRVGPHCDVFVEDNLANYDQLEAAGVRVYLIDRDWNADPGDNRRRVASLPEFADLILTGVLA